MATRTKKKSAKKAEVPMPVDTTEASEWLRALVAAHNEIAAVEADLNERIARMQAEAEACVQPLVEMLVRHCAGLRAFAEANRQRLTDSTAPKTITLTAGELCWRTSPPSLHLKDVEAVLEICEHRGLTQFIRVKKEFDKQAALKDLETAKSIPGVTVEQEENFFIRPTELAAVEYNAKGKCLKASA